MNSKQKKALKAKFSDGLGSLGMMVSTFSEWYDAKHRPPSADEAARLMPALRVGEPQEGRPLEENGPNRQGMQRLRE